jgi:hypothetical protein
MTDLAPTPPIVVPPPTVYEDVCSYKEQLGLFLVVDPPPINWCQLGQIVLTCESWAVGSTGVRTEALYPLGNECQMLTVIDLVAGVARECNFEADENGFTDPALVEAASRQQDTDLHALLTWAESLPKPPLSPVTTQFSSEGGLAITTLTTSAYHGWA